MLPIEIYLCNVGCVFIPLLCNFKYDPKLCFFLFIIINELIIEFPFDILCHYSMCILLT